jgi:hypothetical protein
VIEKQSKNSIRWIKKHLKGDIKMKEVKKWKAEPMTNKPLASEMRRFKKDTNAKGLPKIMR